MNIYFYDIYFSCMIFDVLFPRKSMYRISHKIFVSLSLQGWYNTQKYSPIYILQYRFFLFLAESSALGEEKEKTYIYVPGDIYGM